LCGTLANQTTSLASVRATTNSASNNAWPHLITPDGRSWLSQHGRRPGKRRSRHTQGEIYVRDLQAGLDGLDQFECRANGRSGPVPSTYPQISADGRFVAFQNRFTERRKYRAPQITARPIYSGMMRPRDRTQPSLPMCSPRGLIPRTSSVPNDAGRAVHVYVAQTVIKVARPIRVFMCGMPATRPTQLVSQDQFGNFPSNTFPDTPVITPDGRFVTFQTARPIPGRQHGLQRSPLLRPGPFRPARRSCSMLIPTAWFLTMRQRHEPQRGWAVRGILQSERRLVCLGQQPLLDVFVRDPRTPSLNSSPTRIYRGPPIARRRNQHVGTKCNS